MPSTGVGRTSPSSTPRHVSGHALVPAGWDCTTAVDADPTDAPDASTASSCHEACVADADRRAPPVTGTTCDSSRPSASLGPMLAAPAPAASSASPPKRSLVHGSADALRKTAAEGGGGGGGARVAASTAVTLCDPLTACAKPPPRPPAPRPPTPTTQPGSSSPCPWPPMLSSSCATDPSSVDTDMASVATCCPDAEVECMPHEGCHAEELLVGGAVTGGSTGKPTPSSLSNVSSRSVRPRRRERQ
mmetsp:Transcript_29238/g.95392  ORF Transcript_29238/g.95392 Transcript_29238/m.95392 type:complete len:246 (-) Transcript_29238:741-1478(-)